MSKSVSKKHIAVAMLLVFMFTTIFSSLNTLTVKASTTSVSITESGGYLEGAYLKWLPVNNATGYVAYVKKSGSADSTYVKLDNELIRKYSSYIRVDAIALAKGSYVIKVVPIISGKEDSTKAAVSSTLVVEAHTREGFAFSQNSTMKTGSGAYNNDGTLRSGAQVLYITNENKNTVTLDVIVNSKGGTQTGTGLAAILKLREKGYDTTPLAIRIIGKIEEPADVAGSLLNIKGTQNLTFEGIGEDGTIHGFGLLIRTSKNIEVRNIAVMWFGDDAISLDTNNENIWIHNNDIFYGRPGSDADQAKGDGSIDVKAFSNYVTISYNHLWDAGKASLCGMSDTQEFFVTYHHNWFEKSDSRHPRIRVATAHIYNNYFDGNSKYGVGVTKGSSAFVESNYFENTKYPMLTSMQGTDRYDESKGTYTLPGTFSSEAGGMIKEYGNVIIGAKRFVNQNTTPHSGQFDAITVNNKTDKVSSSYVTVSGGTTYNNFDTNSSIMYSYTADTAEVAKQKVIKYAGRVNGGDFKWTFTSSDNGSDAIITALRDAINNYTQKVVAVGGTNSGGGGTSTPENPGTPDTPETPENPTPSPSGAYTHNFTQDGLTEGFFTFPGTTKNLSTSKGTVTYNGLTLTTALKMETNTKIQFKTVSAGELVLVFNPLVDSCNVKINGTTFTADATGILKVEVEANTTYAIEKASTSNLFYMSVSQVSNQTPSQSYIHNFTDDGVTEGFFTFPGTAKNLSTTKGTVTYNGLTLTRCLKIESSTKIQFQTTKSGELVLVFNPAVDSCNAKINGTTFTADASGVLKVSLDANTTYTIERANAANLFYMSVTQ